MYKVIFQTVCNFSSSTVINVPSVSVKLSPIFSTQHHHYPSLITLLLVCLYPLSHAVVCPAGSFSSGGVCTPCPRDTFQVEEGQVFCSPCPSGTSTVAQGAFSASHCE